jgi:single-strand DNA-binding protein
MLKVLLSGNLGADSEKRYSQTGTAITQFRVAVNTRRKNGEDWEDHTDWFRVSVSGARADFLAEHLMKGVHVTVLGRLQIGEYMSRDNERRTSLDVWADEVEFSAPRRDDDDERPATGNGAPATRQSAPARTAATMTEEDLNDLPF